LHFPVRNLAVQVLDMNVGVENLVREVLDMRGLGKNLAGSDGEMGLSARKN